MQPTPVDDIDAVTKEDLSREIRLEIDLHDAKWHLRDLNVIASPVQDIRSVLDLMPTDTADDWSVISTRLGAIPAALDGYIATLREGIAQGVVPARRQVVEVVTQIARYTNDQGFFASFAAEAAPAEGQLPASLARELADNANAARVSYDALSQFLSAELAPAAGEKDAVGRELYALQSRRFLGATIDLDETYDWGVEELARMVAEQESIADQIKAGASVEEAIAFLDEDPAHKLHGTDALQRVDAGDERPRDRRARQDPLRHPRADPPPRVHDRAHEGGRHLLHRPDRRLLATRSHVVVRPRGRRRSSTPGAN